MSNSDTDWIDSTAGTHAGHCQVDVRCNMDTDLIAHLTMDAEELLFLLRDSRGPHHVKARAKSHDRNHHSRERESAIAAFG